MIYLFQTLKSQLVTIQTSIDSLYKRSENILR